MGFYQDQIVPLLINLTMRRRDLAAYRSRVVPAAEGRVAGSTSALRQPRGLSVHPSKPDIVPILSKQLGGGV